MKQVRIGCYRQVLAQRSCRSNQLTEGSAFWGDSAWAVKQFLDSEDVQIDYLVADYLAELTMGLLARTTTSKSASAKPGLKNGGYIAEFLELALKPNVDKIVKKGIKVIANAGGLDPVGLKEAIEAHIKAEGLSDKVKVAAVSGDNLMSSKDRLMEEGAFEAFDALSGAGSSEPNVNTSQKLLSLNAYLGAEPIAEALKDGATIVVTGRCVDSAVIVGPLAFEFGWKFGNHQTDLDRIAGASLAGHIIECGCQATGGNYTDWKSAAFSAHGGWSNMGYPILTFNEDSSFTITKPRQTGGVVNQQSVCEQMLYEVLDPENYALPDVVLDMSQVVLEQVDSETVLVYGSKGKQPSPFLKCTAVEQHGYRTSVDYVVCGEEAESKAKALAQAVLDRTNRLAYMKFGDKIDPIAPEDSEVIIIGSETSLNISQNAQRREVVVRIGAKHNNRGVLDILSKEAAAFLTNSCPGLFMLSSGRPKSSPNFEVTSTLIQRGKVVPTVHIRGDSRVVPLTSQDCAMIQPAESRTQAKQPSAARKKSEPKTLVKLHTIAIGRSGDKGDVANIAIIARKPELYPFLLDQVTAEVVLNAFNHFIRPGGTVTRFEVPGVCALNFVLTQALGGGGLSSLRLDRQAKSYGQIALSTILVDVPAQAGIAAQL